MSKKYTVLWLIDVDAESPEDAARKALEIQRDPRSTATVFSVQENTPYADQLNLPADYVHVDLLQEKGTPTKIDAICEACLKARRWQNAPEHLVYCSHNEALECLWRERE